MFKTDEVNIKHFKMNVTLLCLNLYDKNEDKTLIDKT